MYNNKLIMVHLKWQNELGPPYQGPATFSNTISHLCVYNGEHMCFEWLIIPLKIQVKQRKERERERERERDRETERESWPLLLYPPLPVSPSSPPAQRLSPAASPSPPQTAAPMLRTDRHHHNRQHCHIIHMSPKPVLVKFISTDHNLNYRKRPCQCDN